MYRHFVVLVDDSDAGIDTVTHAVALARSVGARVTFVHVVREPQYGAGAASGRRLDDCVREMVAAKAEAAARALGVPCESMRVTGAAAQRARASDAGAWRCDLVCVAARAVAARDGVGEAVDVDAGCAAGSLAAQFAAANVPVLSCAVRRSPAAARVVAALYRAHRATGVALCERLAHSGLAHAGRAAVRGAAASEVACEVASDVACDASGAHPGLDALRIPRLGPADACRISSLLRVRTSVVDAELGELERQHQRGTALFEELVRVVAASSAGVAPPARVEEALHGYAQFVWEYFGRKEGVIVPAAQRYLREDDWREIEAAFATTASIAGTGTP
ncbi:universal stress protein [Paraburkholderia silviterrae]|uniref:Universal stress protein n=1 Tax=Paraburkholderia silviterrae TaxID=2528715 RepID=A0A4R5MA22_9BURK|nr:universal stress protein [Paraburkholderia silviterrae]TDG23405.1 universal stress protein [Paraburkholderia silviterrae]